MVARHRSNPAAAPLACRFGCPTLTPGVARDGRDRLCRVLRDVLESFHAHDQPGRAHQQDIQGDCHPPATLMSGAVLRLTQRFACTQDLRRLSRAFRRRRTLAWGFGGNGGGVTREGLVGTRMHACPEGDINRHRV